MAITLTRRGRGWALERSCAVGLAWLLLSCPLKPCAHSEAGSLGKELFEQVHCPEILGNLQDLGSHGDLGAKRFLCLAHRNRSDFCDLRLRCPLRTQKLLAISETLHWGGVSGPTPSPSAPPGQRSSGLRLCCGVCMAIYVYPSILSVPFCRPLCVLSSRCVSPRRPAKSRAKTSLRVHNLLFGKCFALLSWGSSRNRGELRLPRCCGPRKCLP